MSNQELLEEAKRRYPKGTEYYCAHLKSEYKCTVSNPSKFIIDGINIYESYGDIAKNGHACIECIYFNGKWAEIVSTPEPKSFVGRYIKVLDKHAKEQYGINNGDYLLFNAKNSCGTYQLWGDLVFRHYHGINVHTNPDFELMPEGFHPDDVKPLKESPLEEKYAAELAEVKRLQKNIEEFVSEHKAKINTVESEIKELEYKISKLDPSNS